MIHPSMKIADIDVADPDPPVVKESKEEAAQREETARQYQAEVEREHRHAERFNPKKF
jgi:hypothetical protein